MRKGFLVVMNVFVITALIINYGSVLAKGDLSAPNQEKDSFVQEVPSYMIGVLSGKITDGDGGGVAAVTVCAVPDMNWVYLPLIINQSQALDTAGQTSPLSHDALPNVCPNSSQTDQTGSYSFSNLPAGDYTVYPVLYDVSFSPDSQFVSIPYAGSLDFHVLLRDPVIKPEAAVISEVSNQYLESISENGSTFTFSQSTSELQSVAVGDVMVSDASGMAPSGYLRRVISVSDQSGKRVVETEPAFLEDIIEEGSAFLQGALTPAQVVSSDLYPGVKMNQSPDAKSRSFSFSIKDVPIYDHDGFSETVNDRVYASGTLELDLDYDFFIDFHDGTLENLTFAARTTTSDKVEFYSDLELASFGAEWTIASYKFLPVNFLIGGIPVSAVPQLDVVVGADGGVSVGWSASVTHEVINRVGYEYINPAGWQPIRESSENISYDLIPQLGLEATAKGYMGIRFNFYIYGLAGPYVGMFQYFEMKFTTLNTPKLTLSAGVNVPVGFRVEEYVHNFLEDKLVLKLNKYELIAVNTKTVLYETGGSNSAPNEPSEPSPSNGEAQTAINPTLSWIGGDPDGDPVVYDVFFEAGDSSPDVRMAVDIEDTNFTPGLLQPNTTYFWQVNATDSNGFSNTGPVWIFTTTSDSILVPGEMVVIPAGNFQMGCDPNHNGGEPCYSSALPVHTVYLDTYQIDKYEVTNGQYALCVAAGECDSPYYNSSESQTSYFNNPDYENYPVIWVDWYKANAYCTWAGKRLPTEAEWEKAARGSVSIVAYPWGDASPTIDWDATGDHRRCDHSNFEYVCENGDTSEIGSYPSGASPYRLLDMSGNVWEWVSDWVSSSYYSESPLSNPAGPAFGANKGLRGGSFLTFDDGLTASRGSRSPSTKASHIGFRCAASME